MSTYGNELFGRSDEFNPGPRSGGDRPAGAGGGGPRGGGGDALSQAVRNAQGDKSRVIDVNNFDAIRISLASPEAIRAWSYGEVTKPETINYRTLKPEHGGLFCERIFGPTRDWECYCGKYKRIRHAGTVCDKCGVEVTRAKVRRERMAHIELAAPVAHIWYVKGTPSRLGLLLDISPRNLERVLYFASYLVTYVDDERKADTAKEIHAVHDEYVAEARAEADERLAAIGARIEEKIATLDEGVKTLSETAVNQHQAELDALKTEYKKAKDAIRRLKDYPVKNSISFRGEVIVQTRSEVAASVLDGATQTQTGQGEQDAGADSDELDAQGSAPRQIGAEEKAAADDFESMKLGWVSIVERTYADESARLMKEIGYETSGIDAIEGAEKDLASHQLEQSRKKIEDEYNEQVKLSEKERDETLKLLNDVKELNILTETEYRTLHEIVPPGVFKAAMGAEAVYDYVSTRIDLDQLALELRNQMQTDSEVKRKKAVKRLRVVEALRKSGNKPHWMIFTALPVIPPELRPMVQLDGGRFATSDLNDLYRRVINRNNRLKRLLELGAPDIIVRNEKRMLQEAVDALIDNGRRGRVVSGSGKHKLKSLSDMLKGKQGRFRQNLLGKRVDYSGRSVIVVGPNLELDQCGLPKRMALELFKPFVMQRLVHHNYAPNIKAAKRLVERVDERVWEVLEEVIGDYVVLLNRAPTLHRLGIQAFKPKLIEGSAIQIHPLVCQAFNADFDGDQMAVHVPLSKKAQAEAKERMLSIRNLLSPSNGEPIVSPTQDIVLGCYYMTSERDFDLEFEVDNVPRGWGKVFGSLDDVQLAYDAGTLDLQAKITVATDRVPEPPIVGGPRLLTRKTEDGKALQWVETTVGRAIFNRALPPDLNKFYNLTMDRKQLRRVVADCYRHFKDAAKTAKVVNDIKKTGFRYSTIGGMSIAVQDVVMSETKPGILREAQAQADHLDTLYKRGMLTEEERLRELEVIWNDARDRLTDDVQERLKGQNSVWMMADSGAKGNMNQIAQMAGMRGLVLDPQGKIIDIPITSNFREGLTVLEYFIATHGARKGLADTALRTADSGYLTRRLVDVAQDVIITSDDCGTLQGMWVDRLDSNGKELMTADEFRGRVVGRTLATPAYHPETGELIADRGEEISDSREEEDGTVTDMAAVITRAGVDKVHIRTVMTCESMHGVCALCYGRNLATRQRVNHGEAVGIIAAQSIGEPGTQLTMRTFHTGGVARADITTGLPRVEELFEARKPKGYALLADREGEVFFDAETRRISIKPHERDIDRVHVLETWTLEVAPGEMIIENKTVIATSPEGLRLFSRISGEAMIDGDAVVVIGYEPQPIAVEDVEPSSSSDYKDGVVPGNHRVIVENGTFVTLGQPLVDGPLHPQHLLLYLGPDVVQRYIIDEVQKVYKSQGVNTNDKHIEVICRQMLRKVTITYPGDTDYLQDETMRIDRLEFIELNRQILAQGGEPATAIPVLLGITKASLETDSFLSSASFQETTKVLTEAAINGKVDGLRGLKENVIIGKLIPAGSGFGGPVVVVDDALVQATVAATSTATAVLEPAADEDIADLMDAGLLPTQREGVGIEDAGFQIESGGNE